MLRRLATTLAFSMLATLLAALPARADDPRTEPHPDISVEVVSARLGQTVLRREGACVFVRVKNHSQETIYSLELVIYYLDRSGKPFFELNWPIVSTGSFVSAPDAPLRPNYSREGSSCATSEDHGFILSEWAPGKVRVEIKEAVTEDPNASRASDTDCNAEPELTSDGKHLVHTVQWGELPATIVRKYKITLQELLNANPDANWQALRPCKTQLLIPIRKE